MTTEEMLDVYDVRGFALGLAVVRRKSDDVLGTLEFTNVDGMRYYHDFLEA